MCFVLISPTKCDFLKFLVRSEIHGCVVKFSVMFRHSQPGRLVRHRAFKFNIPEYIFLQTGNYKTDSQSGDDYLVLQL